MAILARARNAAWFGADVVRAVAAGVGAALRPPTPRPPRDEVHLLVEGDPARGLSPAARYRALQYVPLLAERGFDCRVWPSRPAKYWSAAAGFQRAQARWPRAAAAWALVQHWRQARNRRRDFAALAGGGVVLLQRDLLALPESRLELELPLWNRHVVFDFDDAIWIRPPWARAGGGAEVDAALKAKVAAICSLSTCVIAANAHLAEFARQHCARVHVLPTALCTEEFAPPPQLPKAQPPKTQPPQNARPVVGWAGTSGNLWYLRRLAPALQQLRARRDFALRVVCNRLADDQQRSLCSDFAALGDSFEFVEWSAEGEVQRLQQFDVGIMPLDDDEWARGKAGFKLIQYMACGVPFVASPVGANVDVGGADGDCGRYATSDSQWTAALDALLADAQLRRAQGQRGRARAAAMFDRRRHIDALAAILREAALA